MTIQDAEYLEFSTYVDYSEPKISFITGKLIDDKKVREYLSLDEIDKLIDPANYIGSADEMIERVLKKVAHD